MVVGRRSFPFNKAYFQVQAVRLLYLCLYMFAMSCISGCSVRIGIPQCFKLHQGPACSISPMQRLESNYAPSNVSIENSNYFQKATNTELLFQGSIVRVQLRMSRVSGVKNIQKYQSCGWSAVHLLLAIAPFIVGRPSMPFHCISQTTIFTKDTHTTWRWEGRPFQNLPM